MDVDAVSINASKSLSNVDYDASKRQLDEIEEIVRKYQCDISHDGWTHFKEGYYKFVDQNVKDNGCHEPWGCCQRGVHSLMVNKFGTKYVRCLIQRHRGYGDMFHLDEVFVKINGKQHYLRRAVDQDGEVVDVYLQ